MDFRAIMMGCAFALMWSSAFTSARIIVADAPPLMALSLRFLIAGLLGVAVARMLGQSWHLTKDQWIATIVFGVCQNALYLGLNFVAMQWMEASIAVIVASTMPLLVALFGWALFKETVPPLGVAGLIIGFIGVGLIMGTRISAEGDLLGLSLMVGGAIALTIATLAVRSASSGGNLLMIIGLQMLFGSFALAVVAIPLEELDVTWSGQLIGAFLYTTFIPGLAAMIIWFALVQRIGTIRASTFHFLNPFLGVAIASAVLDEVIGPLDVIGVCVIAAGIFAVQISKPRN